MTNRVLCCAKHNVRVFVLCCVVCVGLPVGPEAGVRLTLLLFGVFPQRLAAALAGRCCVWSYDLPKVLIHAMWYLVDLVLCFLW